jgi:hypothetical protein
MLKRRKDIKSVNLFQMPVWVYSFCDSLTKAIFNLRLGSGEGRGKLNNDYFHEKEIWLLIINNLVHYIGSEIRQLWVIFFPITSFEYVDFYSLLSFLK